MPKITFDQSDFIQGIALNDMGLGGGYTYAQGLNIREKPGVVQPHDDGANQSRGSNNEIYRAVVEHDNEIYFFSESDGDSTGRIDRYSIVNDTWNGFNIVSNNIEASTVSDGVFYDDGTTSSIYFSWGTGVGTDILQLDLSAFSDTSVDDTWWSATESQGGIGNTLYVPLHVFEDILWIGEINKLSNYDAGTSTANVLTLSGSSNIVDISDVSIYLAIATVDGSFTSGSNSTVDVEQDSRVYLWDQKAQSWNYDYRIPGSFYKFEKIGSSLFAVMVHENDRVGLWQLVSLDRGFEMVVPDIGLRNQGRTTTIDGMFGTASDKDSIYVALRDDTDTSNRFVNIMEVTRLSPKGEFIKNSAFVAPTSTNQYTIGSIFATDQGVLALGFEEGSTRDIRIYDKFDSASSSPDPTPLIRLPAISHNKGSGVKLETVKLVFDSPGNSDDYDVLARTDFSGSFGRLMSESSPMVDGSATSRASKTFQGGVEGEFVELQVEFPGGDGALRKVVVQTSEIDKQ